MRTCYNPAQPELVSNLAGLNALFFGDGRTLQESVREAPLQSSSPAVCGHRGLSPSPKPNPGYVFVSPSMCLFLYVSGLKPANELRA